MPTKIKKSQENPKHPGGRPSNYTKEIGDKICDIIATTSLAWLKFLRIMDFQILRPLEDG